MELVSRKEWLDKELAKVLEERNAVATFEKVREGGRQGGREGLAAVGPYDTVCTART